MDQSGAAVVAQPPPVRLLRSRGPRIFRDLKGLSPVLARVGQLELRLATSKKQLRKLQRLRYRIFYDLGDAIPDAWVALTRRDKCPFDRLCDHLMVVALPTDAGGTETVVGTARLLRGEVALAQDGFYSESEFALDPLLDRHDGTRFLEIGRTCVHPDFRSRRVIDLLWRGVGIYAAHHDADVLIGCSSLPGTQAERLMEPLSYAFHYAAAPRDWQVTALDARAVRMDWLAKGDVDRQEALRSFPPLLKAYVRAGGRFASEAVVDRQFGTIDLFTVLPLSAAAPRYASQYGLAPAPVEPERGLAP